MANKKADNPFYVLLVIVGVAFGVTALGYGVMAGVSVKNPEQAADSIESGRGPVAFLHEYGAQIMIVELALLAAATVLAIGTDGFWTRRAEAKRKELSNREPNKEGAQQ